MKVIAFSYTDSKGKTSQRQVMVLSEPVKHVTALDLESLGDEDVKAFVQGYNAEYDKFMQKVQDLKAKFDCEFKFRQFKTEGMEDVVAKYI